MNELKPCPWCGSNARISKSKRNAINDFFGKCANSDDACCVQPETCWYNTEAEAITAWNTRAAPTIDIDMLRANVQSLLDDCAHILNRRTNGIKLQHEWDGISLNAVRDIKQRAGVMLALLNGEEI